MVGGIHGDMEHLIYLYQEILCLDHEIVLVTINYRLGPFGWFIILLKQ